MTESKPIPRLARTAATSAQLEFARTINNLGLQTLEAMGLSTDQGWSVDFTAGVATRQAPDAAPPAAAETPSPTTPATGEANA